MRICKFILATVLCFTSPNLHGEVYKFTKGLNTFEIKETSKEYQVICTRSSGGISSKNKNITDRQLRMDAIDLIGAYIIYKDSDVANQLSSDYFQIYVEGLNLHYEATLEGMRRSDKTVDGKPATCYSCDKDAYKITCASYNSNIDFASLIEAHYQKDKSEESAALVYSFSGFTPNQYADLERDYLTGIVQIPSGIRLLQNTADRFEMSIVAPGENNFQERFKDAKATSNTKEPYIQFYYTELVTSAPLKDKKGQYDKWVKSLNSEGNVYESILAFCAQNCCQKVPIEADATLTSTIEAFPGAISPFGIRQPTDNSSYNKAAQAYAKSDFSETARILKDAIDIEGITPEMLNLIGASYRFLNQPKRAMPYLLLCFKIAPNTPYLSGNIYLCLSQLGFTRQAELREFLTLFAKDSWSKNELK